jgi:hypothetical protein
MHGAHSPPAVTGDGLLTMTWYQGTKDPPDNWGGWSWGLVSQSNPRDLVELLKQEGSTVGTGAGDERMMASVFGDVVFAIHSSGFYWANPATQNGAFRRSEKKWYTDGFPQYFGAYMVPNNQTEGVCPVSGAAGRLYHQTFDLVYCMEPRN